MRVGTARQSTIRAVTCKQVWMQSEREKAGLVAEVTTKSSITTPRCIGDSAEMQQLHSMIDVIGHRHCTVMILGESGSGKELVARQIHVSSPRATNPFVAVDCTTLRDTLLESELFGHQKGSFTGADRSTLGFVRAADGGTLFLDEVGELAPQVQAKLLRMIQEREVTPVGSTTPVSVDVRILAATHRDLRQMMLKGEFREDLYYRLNVVTVAVPPLRERRNDIPALAEHFLTELSELYQEPAKSFTEDALEALRSYDWPGNVRELANAIEHAYVLCEQLELTARDLPQTISTAASQSPVDDGTEFPTLANNERALLMRALRVSKGNQALAARMLNVERHRFYRMLRRHGLQTMVKA